MASDEDMTRRKLMTAAGAIGLGTVGMRAGAAQVPKVPKQTRDEGRRRIALGGVGAKPHAPAIRGLALPAKPRAVPGPPVHCPSFAYWGGPVVGCAQVYPSFWGPTWSSDPGHLARAMRLTQFHQDLLASGFMNVLNQYGVGGGIVVRPLFFNVGAPSILADSYIRATIQTAIDTGVLPEPTNPTNTITLMIYLEEGIVVNDPAAGVALCMPSDTAFGYHQSFLTKAGNPFYYGVVAPLDDACLQAVCPDDQDCPLHLNQTQEQRQTQVASHEFAEMTTDPQLDAWTSKICGEIGDICNGTSGTITVGGNTWTVQGIYSLTDDINSKGAVFCQAVAPAPVPTFRPAPDPGAIAQARGAGHPLLPLFPLQFDVKSRRVSMDEKSVRDYVNRIFRPLRPRHLTADLPGSLRKIADILAKS
jgi:hypothetical protein